VGDKLAWAENEPGFYWNIALYYFERRRPMPPALCRHVAFRAYLYLKNDGRIADRDLTLAYARQQRRIQRDLLRGFILTKATLEQIASWLRLRVQVVWLFSELFWNVRHRLEDDLFMADLLFLDRFGEQDDGLALMQIAYTEGALAFARAARLVHVAPSSESTPELYDRLERSILLDANAGADRRLYGAKLNAAGNQALSLLLARKNHAQQEIDEDMRRGLGGMSVSRSVNDAVEKIFKPDVDRRVALQLGQVTDQAREQAKKDAQNSQDKSGHKEPH
jgi:hypothetical protein